MANPNSPIMYKTLTSYNDKLKTYIQDRYVKIEKGKELSTNDFDNEYKEKVDKSLQNDDFETEPIDFEDWLTE